jgi:hypothetical protein
LVSLRRTANDQPMKRPTPKTKPVTMNVSTVNGSSLISSRQDSAIFGFPSVNVGHGDRPCVPFWLGSGAAHVQGLDVAGRRLTCVIDASEGQGSVDV